MIFNLQKAIIITIKSPINKSNLKHINNNLNTKEKATIIMENIHNFF